jgi:hypothetical protein
MVVALVESTNSRGGLEAMQCDHAGVIYVVQLSRKLDEAFHVATLLVGDLFDACGSTRILMIAS